MCHSVILFRCNVYSSARAQIQCHCIVSFGIKGKTSNLNVIGKPHNIITFFITINCIVAYIVFIEDKSVVAVAAIECIVAGAAIERVVSGATFQMIISVTTE